jgi:hypothetical protein
MEGIGFAQPGAPCHDSPSPKAQSNKVNQLWTETCETKSQNKTIFFI